MLGKSYSFKVVRFGKYDINLEIQNEKSRYDFVLNKADGKNLNVGDVFEGFVYLYDKEFDKYIVTSKKPNIKLGELAYLEVKDIAKIGVFLDWGLDKDLFLPYQELTFKLQKGRKYLFKMYLDTSNRLCASSKIKDLLLDNSDYEINDWVEGTIYVINHDYGAFVAVDDKYDALIQNKDIFGVITEGERISARVIGKSKEGKLNLSLRDRADKIIGEDANQIIAELERNNGFLPLNDNSDPKVIRQKFGISKSSFKKAIGHLYREKEIEILENGIKLLGEDDD